MTKTMKRTMLASLVTATLLTAGVALNTQAVDASSECLLTMRAGASVRIDEETGTGIRFTANIDESLVKVDGEGETATYSIDYTKGVTEVGMIVVPSFTLDGLEANEDVFAHLQADWNAPKSEVSAIPGKVYKDDNGYFVAGAIVELKDANFDEEYTAIPYTYDGTSYTYGEASEERTIHYVFNEALEQETNTEKRAKILNKVVEMQQKLDFGDIRISNFDGYDLSKFAMNGDAEWAIVSAGVGTHTATPTDGVLEAGALPGAATRVKDAQNFTITYENGKQLTFPAQVWMKEVSEFSDLQEMAALTATQTQYKLGYVGVTASFTCDKNTELKMNGIVGGSNESNAAVVDYIFDGQGNTITNFNGALGNQIRAKFMNLNMIDCYSPAGRGLFGNIMLGGSSVSNVNITTTLYKWDVSSGIANDVRYGTLTMDNVNIVAIDSIVDSSYNGGTRHGIVFGRTLKTIASTLNVTDCTFVGVDVNKTDSLPLMGAPSTAGDANYNGTAYIGTESYYSHITGTYKHYGYKNLGQLTFSTANETESFKAFVTANNLKSNWGPINVSPIAVSDTQGLKDMVTFGTAKANGYYYLTNDINFDATTFGHTADSEGANSAGKRAYSSYAFVEGNGFAIKNLNRHLFNKFGGTVQNLALYADGGSSGWGRGLIAAYAYGNMTLENVFIQANVGAKNASYDLTYIDGCIVANAASPMTLKDVVILCNNVDEQWYSGAIAGLVRKTAASDSPTAGQAVTCTNDNTVIITKTRVAGAYGTTGGDFLTKADFEGNDGIDGNYDNFMKGTWNQYQDSASFEKGYQGTLSAHNLKYYQQLVNANYGK